MIDMVSATVWVVINGGNCWYPTGNIARKPIPPNTCPPLSKFGWCSRRRAIGFHDAIQQGSPEWGFVTLVSRARDAAGWMEFPRRSVPFASPPVSARSRVKNDGWLRHHAKQTRRSDSAVDGQNLVLRGTE